MLIVTKLIFVFSFVMLYSILKVEACRARLDLLVDETPKPTVAWKESCVKAIIPQVNNYTP